MAFVFRSDLKSSFEPKNDNILGPGQYLPIYDKKKINKVKVPFLSSSPRKTDKGIQDVPGPGSYITHDIQDKNFPKMDKNNQMNSTAIYRALEGSNILGEIDPVQIWVNGHYEKLGFLSKIKRFKDSINDDIPGPGSYIQINPYSDKTKKSKKLNKIENFLSKKPLFEDLNPNKIETIPAKKHIFGFDYDTIGSLIRNNDPESVVKFNGEKTDCVGPGNYNTLKPHEWFKKGTNLWSKSKTKKFSQTNTYLRNSNSNTNLFDNNKTSSTFYKSDKGYQLTNDNNISDDDCDLLKKNKNKKSRSFDNNNTNQPKKIKIDVKILKDKTKKIREVLLMNHTNKLFDRSYLLKSRGEDNDPGPGYYFNETHTAFRSKPLPEERQVFGSNCQRFPKIELISPAGPGYYHNQKNSLEKLRKKELKDKLLIPQMAKIKKYKPVKVEGKDLPGPGYYNYEDFFESKKRVNTADNNFGSLEPRFKKFSKTNNLNFPGPGTYIGLNFWGSRENNNFANIFNKPMTSNGNIRTSTFYNDNKKPSKNKYQDSYFDKKSKDIIPPIGTYNPDHIMNLDYKIAKQCIKNTLNEAPFNITKTRPRFELNDKSRSVSSNLGPGIYYKDKNRSDRQIKNPFNAAESRFKETHPKYTTNPGQYDTSSFYDWNRKTFNILYI